MKHCYMCDEEGFNKDNKGLNVKHAEHINH